MLALVVLSYTYHYRIQAEERMLLTLRNQEYDEYRTHTWKLVPFIYWGGINRSKQMVTRRDTIAGLPAFFFASRKAWVAWLSQIHTNSPGIWLRIAKKASDLQSVSYDEALEVALCYGWIDGQKQSYDGSSWLQRFTRRGAKSIWSKINRAKAEDLIKRGKMKLAGLQSESTTCHS